ncbi:MAG: hypothetical protein IT385_26325 [Deltaproteobacteria bacterium]|nr:hypothetical protein [Deltaproteobacteria bacterium]
MRMARIQLYLPDDLYELVKTSGIAASELFQKAVRAELKRRQLLSETDGYLEKLVREVGAPTRSERARADAMVKRLDRRAAAKTG